VILLNPFQEEALMALAEAQYLQYRSKFNELVKMKSCRGSIIYWPLTRITGRERNFSRNW